MITIKQLLAENTEYHLLDKVAKQASHAAQKWEDYSEHMHEIDQHLPNIDAALADAHESAEQAHQRAIDYHKGESRKFQDIIHRDRSNPSRPEWEDKQKEHESEMKSHEIDADYHHKMSKY